MCPSIPKHITDVAETPLDQDDLGSAFSASESDAQYEALINSAEQMDAVDFSSLHEEENIPVEAFETNETVRTLQAFLGDLTPEELACIPASERVVDITPAELEKYRQKIRSIFGPHGVLSQNIKGYRPRQAQLEFALSLLDTMAGHGTFVAEAGTGTGKTFAYLVPALVTNSRVIVSTAGKALQDQLIQKDIPMLLRALDLHHVDVAVLKGRNNYVCPYRLELAISNLGEDMDRYGKDLLSLPTRFKEEGIKNREPESNGASSEAKSGKRPVVSLEEKHDKFKKIEIFRKNHYLAEISDCVTVPPNDPVWREVISTRETCLGKNCHYYESECPVYRARKKAMFAQVVVVNHHLYLSAMALRLKNSNAVDTLLPPASLTIFDEAHQVHDTSLTFFGETMSLRTVAELAQTVRVEGMASSLRVYADWDTLGSNIGKIVRELNLLAELQLKLDNLGPQNINNVQGLYRLREKFTELIVALSEMAAAIDALKDKEEASEIQGYRTFFNEMVDLGTDWIQNVFNVLEDKDEAQPITENNVVRWISYSHQGMVFNKTPLSVSAMFKDMRDKDKGTWAFTSATLADRPHCFDHFKHQLGISECTENTWDSPFDYFEQGVLWVPEKMTPQRNPEDNARAMVEKVWPVISAARGRTFVLCTSLSAMNYAGELLRQRVELNGNEYLVLVQGDKPKNQLLDEFRAHGNAILVGSLSFWEGVDVKGEALSLVVIDKLPFPSPADPVFAARSEALEKQGQSSFRFLSIPEATILLKQGCGRLIRSEQDHGVIVICDSRLIEKPYGKIIQQALPGFLCTTSQQDAMDKFLNPQELWRRFHY